MGDRGRKAPGRKQVAEWRGAFGDAYIERNAATPERVRQRVAAFGQILSHLRAAPPESILEGGANLGLNLRALFEVTLATLYAVEPNARARAILVEDGVVPDERVFDATLADLPLGDGAMDMVFTYCVLIHVPDEALEASCRELYRVARRYVLCLEYFSPTPVTVHYRGHDDLLFKRDYGGLWLDTFSDLEVIAYGFFWKRTTGLDDVNWWLFHKT